MQNILIAGIVVLGVLLAVGLAIMALRRNANCVPEGLHNSNAATRTPLTTDSAIDRDYEVVEHTTPTSHYVRYRPIRGSSVNVDLNEGAEDSRWTASGSGRHSENQRRGNLRAVI